MWIRRGKNLKGKINNIELIEILDIIPDWYGRARLCSRISKESGVFSTAWRRNGYNISEMMAMKYMVNWVSYY